MGAFNELFKLRHDLAAIEPVVVRLASRSGSLPEAGALLSGASVFDNLYNSNPEAQSVKRELLDQCSDDFIMFLRVASSLVAALNENSEEPSDSAIRGWQMDDTIVMELFQHWRDMVNGFLKYGSSTYLVERGLWDLNVNKLRLFLAAAYADQAYKYCVKTDTYVPLVDSDLYPSRLRLSRHSAAFGKYPEVVVPLSVAIGHDGQGVLRRVAEVAPEWCTKEVYQRLSLLMATSQRAEHSEHTILVRTKKELAQELPLL